MGTELKRMAELLKSGATMLSQSCPECGSPLFRVRDEIICARCNKPVVIIKATDEEGKITSGRVLDEVEQTILSKIGEINNLLATENDAERLLQYGKALSIWLDVLDRVRRLKLD